MSSPVSPHRFSPPPHACNSSDAQLPHNRPRDNFRLTGLRWVIGSVRKIKAGRRLLVWTVSAVLLALGLAAIGVELGFYQLPKVPASGATNSPVALEDSSILLAGGYDSNSSAVTATAELYDLATRQFSATGTMTAARVNHTATRLKNGKVLITGGASNNDPLREGGILNSAELYDPATGAFRATGSMNFERVGHTAALLPQMGRYWL